MSDSRSHGLPSPGVCAGIVIAMLAMIAIPAAITLHAVQGARPTGACQPALHTARLQG